MSAVAPRTLEAPAVGMPAVAASIRRRGWLVRRALLAADLAGLALAYAAAQATLPAAEPGVMPPHWETALFMLTTLPGWVVVAKLKGLYDRDEEHASHSTVDDLAGVFQLATLGAWLLVASSWVTDLAHPHIGRVVAFWAFTIVLVTGLRLVARMLARRTAAYVQRTIVVGTGQTGHTIARKILQHPEYGIDLVGFVDAEPLPGDDETVDVPVLGTPAELPELVAPLGVDRVIIAFTQAASRELIDLIRVLRERDVQVDFVPRFFEVMGPRTIIHSVEGLALVGLPPIRLSRSSRLLKRVVDVVLSAAALILLSPLLAVVAAIVRLDSPGPVLFRQARMGADDRPFEILKFRTMSVGADSRRDELRHRSETGDPRLFKLRNDPRVTRAGRPLRRLSIDELPQLVNVLRGEMSLVGPRPLPLDEDENITDWGRRRLDLRPGITGLWQTLGRSDIPFEEMLRLDYLYVTSWSLWNDVRIMLRTFPVLAGRSGGAY